MKILFFVLSICTASTLPNSGVEALHNVGNFSDKLGVEEMHARHEVCSRFAYTQTDLFKPGSGSLHSSEELYVSCIASDVPHIVVRTSAAAAASIAHAVDKCGGKVILGPNGKVTISGWIGLNCLETVELD